MNKLYKYTSVKEIFNEIVGKSKEALHMERDEKQETRIPYIAYLRPMDISAALNAGR